MGSAAVAKPTRRHDSDNDDLSPPRQKAAATAQKKQRNDSDSDLSPPRPSGGGSAATKKGRHDSDADLSPPRRGSGGAKNEGDETVKMTSGLRAGLVAGEALKAEAAE